jgi:GntR family transcriptional repressor for pyruvate dehydrogenase complex
MTAPPVAERVRRAILDGIARGEFGPGDRLPGERRLAEQLGASRVSVRAALQQLKARGLLDARRGGGTRVVSTVPEMDAPLADLVRAKAENLADLAEIRMVLEVWAAHRAAVHATPPQIAEIGRIVDGMADPARHAVRAEDDVAFHVAVGRAAGSPVYLHFLNAVREALAHMLQFHREELFGEHGDASVLAQHRAVHAAIAARDAAAAEAAMRRHLAWVLDHYRAAGALRGHPPGP